MASCPNPSFRSFQVRLSGHYSEKMQLPCFKTERGTMFVYMYVCLLRELGLKADLEDSVVALMLDSMLLYIL